MEQEYKRKLDKKKGKLRRIKDTMDTEIKNNSEIISNLKEDLEYKDQQISKFKSMSNL